MWMGDAKAATVSSHGADELGVKRNGGTICDSRKEGVNHIAKG